MRQDRQLAMGNKVVHVQHNGNKNTLTVDDTEYEFTGIDNAETSTAFTI